MSKVLFAPVLASVALLSACMTYEPVSQDKEGRSIVAAADAASLFTKYCYNSPNGSAAKRSGLFTTEPTGLDGSYSGKHKTKAVDITSIKLTDTNSCIMSFLGPKTTAESAADTAVALMAKLPVKNIGGKKGGGQINLITSNGTVIVGNNSKSHPQGYNIMLLNKK